MAVSTSSSVSVRSDTDSWRSPGMEAFDSQLNATIISSLFFSDGSSREIKQAGDARNHAKPGDYITCQKKATAVGLHLSHIT